MSGSVQGGLGAVSRSDLADMIGHPGDNESGLELYGEGTEVVFTDGDGDMLQAWRSSIEGTIQVLAVRHCQNESVGVELTAEAARAFGEALIRWAAL